MPAARRISKAVDENEPMWIEDPIRMDTIAALAELAHATPIPLVASETLGTRFNIGDTRATSGRDRDGRPRRVGGVTEARRVADLAALYLRPFTPLDCTSR